MTVLFDTIAADDGFDTDYLTISGGAGGGGRQSVAVPFTASVDSKITQIEVVLRSVPSGVFDTMEVFLLGSTLGGPGKVKHSWTVSGVDDTPWV